MMNPDAQETRAVSLRAHPNIRTAAKLIGVDPSTLSRRKDLRAEERGERDKVLAPAEVMRLAAIYRQRSLNDVGNQLIAMARDGDPDNVRAVEDEVESFFDQRVDSADSRTDFLVQARRLLPLSLYRAVEVAVSAEADDPPQELDGQVPIPPES